MKSLLGVQEKGELNLLRTEREMLVMFIEFAKQDDRIRCVTLEGSRTITLDAYQDYDISYSVTDLDSFKANNKRLDAFGARLMMQKPEDKESFPPELVNGFPRVYA